MKGPFIVERLQRAGRRWVIALTVWAVYALAFVPLYRLIGIMAVAFEVFPILTTSWALGTIGGLLAGALALPLSLALLTIGRASSAEALSRGGLMGWLVLVLMGGLVGRLHELSRENKEKLAEREQAEEALQRQNRHLSTLLETADLLSTTLRFGLLVEEVLRQLAKLVPYDTATVALVQDDQVQIVGCQGWDGAVRDQRCPLADWPIVEQAVEGKRPVLLSGDEVRASGSPGEEAASLAQRLATPLTARDRVIGVLTIGSRRRDSFDTESKALVAAFAHQAALAMENSRLYEQKRSQLREVTVLQEVTSAMSSTLDVDQIVPYVAHSLCELLNATSVELYTMENGRKTATLVTAYAADDATPKERAMRPRLAETWEDVPALEETLRLNEPVRARLDDSSLPPATRERLEERDAKALLLLPITTREHTLGFVCVWDSAMARRFTTDEVATGQTLTRQTAIALENARLFEQIQETLTETSVLYRASRSLIAQEHLPDILQTVVDGVIEAVPADRATVITLDFKRQEVTNFVKSGPGADHVVSTSFDELWNGLTGWVLRKMEPALSPKGEPDPREGPRARLRREETSCGSIVVVPLVYRDKALGTMTAMNRPDQRDFTDRDVDLMMAFANQAAAALENARLIEESQRRANQLAGAADIARHATAITNPVSLLQVVVDLIQDQFGFYLASVFLVDETENDLYPGAATENFWDLIPDGYRQPMGKGAIGTAAQTGETLRIPDATRSAVAYRVGEWLSPSSLSVPIQVGDLTIGVLEVEADVTSAFEESDQMALEVVADQIAIAYQNAELLTETRSRMKDLQLLHDVSLAAAASAHLQETLQAAAEALAAEWKGTQIALQLLDPESETLRTKASIGYPCEEAQATELTLGEGITGWVARHGEPALVSDVHDDDRYYAVTPETRSELCVPLSLGDRVIGTLNVESPEIDAFSVDDQRLLTTLGSNLAILVERARLFEQVEGARAELQQRAEALEEANARLKELDRLKSQFLANMSHELRTPLNSVIGFSEVLIDGLLGEMPPEQEECVENIRVSGEHLMALINDILDLSKIEAGRMQLSLESFCVTDLIENVRKTVSPMIKEKSQTLMVKVKENLPALTADRIRVRQVLLNLLSNAHKFTPEGNKITLTCRLADPATMLFSVIDTGIGIEQEDQELIFEEFRQADGTATREAEGTGLGLTISKRLIEMHGGTIWVESTYGEGASFSFLLPVTGPMTKREKREEAMAPRRFDPKVLIIEDDRRFSNLLSLYLRKEGYDPVQHYGGSDVLDKARRLNPRLITLDVMLPDGDGWEILQCLKSDPETQDTPVLVISALRNGELALSLGATDYLVKPVNCDALHTVLKRLPTRRPSSEEPRILVIDDDVQIVSLLRAMLRDQACSLVGAHSGEEGVARARREQPDAILLDLMMPRMSGFEVLEELKSDERTSNIPVIVLTVKNVTREEREQLNNRIERLMYKHALTPQDLAEEIHRLGDNTVSASREASRLSNGE